MKKDVEKTRVAFLVNEQNQDLFALFVETVRMEGGGRMYDCYSHVGQHSACFEGYANESRNATPEEYKDLKTELEEIGYNVKNI